MPGDTPQILLAHSTADLVRCFAVIKQLRPALTSNEYIDRLRIQENEGYRTAFVSKGESVVAVAGFRIQHMLSTGRTLYVDDLITDADSRSQGYGELLFKWMVNFARNEHCDTLALDSATHRFAAHRFYARQRINITDFHYELALGDAVNAGPADITTR